MTTNRFTIPVLFSMLLLVPGCAALGGGGASIQNQRAAEADEMLKKQIEFLQKRPVEPWSGDDARRALLEPTIAINTSVPEGADEQARTAYTKPRFTQLHQAWTDFFARAHKSAMSDGDPELAQGLTGTQMILQEEFEWSVDRADILSRFHEEADAIATYRQGVFAKRNEYAKLNELTCIASDKPLQPIDKPQPDIRWHFKKDSEIHVRCSFPTSLKSQVGGGVSYTISGELNVIGTKGEGKGEERLVRTNVKIPVEVAGFIDGRHFDFAFDLSAQTKGLKWGYVRIDGNVEWVTGDEDKGLEKHVNSAFMRVSFE